MVRNQLRASSSLSPTAGLEQRWRRETFLALQMIEPPVFQYEASNLSELPQTLPSSDGTQLLSGEVTIPGNRETEKPHETRQKNQDPGEQSRPQTARQVKTVSQTHRRSIHVASIPQMQSYSLNSNKPQAVIETVTWATVAGSYIMT